MENISIEIKKEEYLFAGEVLFKHMRQIEPLTMRMQKWEIGSFDYILELSRILCISDNKDKITENIDNLNKKEIGVFTKDFEKVMNAVNKEDEAKKK